MEFDELIGYMKFTALGIVGGTALVVCLVLALRVIVSVIQAVFTLPTIF